jgi:hypothetical protein
LILAKKLLRWQKDRMLVTVWKPRVSCAACNGNMHLTSKRICSLLGRLISFSLSRFSPSLLFIRIAPIWSRCTDFSPGIRNQTRVSSVRPSFRYTSIPNSQSNFLFLRYPVFGICNHNTTSARKRISLGFATLRFIFTNTLRILSPPLQNRTGKGVLHNVVAKITVNLFWNLLSLRLRLCHSTGG